VTWLVLCEPYDAAAMWAYRGLASRGLEPLELVDGGTAAALAGRCHEVDGYGNTRADLVLPDGRTIRGDDVIGVLNRVVSAVPSHVVRATRSDREYAAQEFTALFLSWLRALPCVVLNPATPLGLSGQWRYPAEWAVLAARAGFATPPYRRSSTEAVEESRRTVGGDAPAERTVFAVADEVVGAPDEGSAGRCRELARLAETPLLGISMSRRAEGWTFLAATPHPDLSAGGDPLLDALARALHVHR